MNEFDPKAVLSATRVIYFGVLGMPVLFLIAVFTMINGDADFSISFKDPLILVLIILFLIMVPVSIIVPKSQTKILKLDSDLKLKLATFQTVLIIKAAIWAGIANFGIVISLLELNLFPICVGIIAILIIAMNYPSLSNIRKTITLNSEDLKKLEGYLHPKYSRKP